MADSADRPAPRIAAAAICILYGFAKLNGSQFTVLDSELSKPMGEVSGFWLTWHYFAYSPVYGTFIALVEVAGGLLLLWPRTALLAALGLLPMAVNIALIDVFYGVDIGGTVMAFVLTACLAAVVAPHVNRLRHAVLPPDAHPARMSTRQITLAAAMVAGAFVFTYWIANVNNRAPTPIDGVWTVASDSRQPARWTHVFFEYNRAHKAIFRGPDGADTERHFEVDGRTVRIQETWLDRSSAVVMSGTYDGAERIRLEVAETAGGGVLELRRRP